jgi:hypothetical protein
MYGVFRSREYWRESADRDDDMAIVATAGEVLAIRGVIYSDREDGGAVGVAIDSTI